MRVNSWEERLFFESVGLFLTSGKTINRTSLENTLLARVERVALGAAFHFDFASDRASSNERVSARADNLRLAGECWMDSCFHKA